MVQVLSPIFEQQFSNSSYGFRPNRWYEQAVIKALECFNDGYDWIVDIIYKHSLITLINII